VEYLTVNEVILVHARLVQLTGGSRGIPDMGLLESAVARPQVTFDGAELYPDLWSKAAALMHSLTRTHPFIDGNKRTALTATGILLRLNGFGLTASNDEALDFTRRVTVGEMELEDMAAWLRTHCQALEPGQ